jgi:hypothetical protein
MSAMPEPARDTATIGAAEPRHARLRHRASTSAAMLIRPLQTRNDSLRPLAWWLLFAAMVVTVLVYWPSLHGGYIFDDSVYFVENIDVHVTTLHLEDWVKAALQQAGTNQFRALSMLSFAANYYFTGLDPFWPKLTNLLIHLVNGLLLFLLLREAFRLREMAEPRVSNTVRTDLLAAFIASAWLLLPINFTGVAYVAQRMESLANIFVFLGLLWYLRLRQQVFSGHGGGMMLFLGMLGCMALGFSAKETGAMLPLYTVCAEFAITRFRNVDGKFSRPAIWSHAILLGLPLIAGLAWLTPRLSADMSHFRTFTVAERLLTEPRVLMHYIGWSLLPDINALTFYHDDIRASRDLFDPPMTFVAILALLALLSFALWRRKSMPIFCLGVLWFFAGHALTATVIMLELVFEHRNYFASSGLLLAMASLLAMEPGLRMSPVKIAIAVAFLSTCAFTTFLRSEEWSHPLRLAYAEAVKRPESPRAQYELARTLIIVAGKNEDSPLLKKSTEILERTAMQPDSGITSLQALIFINRRDPQKIDPRWWQAITEKLHASTPDSGDIGAVIFLFKCQERGDCPQQTPEMLSVFTSALEATGGNVNLLSAYADFALKALGDTELAERMSREAVATNPVVPTYRANLIKILMNIGKLDDAQTEIEKLSILNHAGSLNSLISGLQAQLMQARTSRAEVQS